MKKQVVVVCCPSSENMTKKDKKEIYNLLIFKERYENFLKNKERKEKENDRH